MGISLLLDLMVALHKYPQITFESLYLRHLTAVSCTDIIMHRLKMHLICIKLL